MILPGISATSPEKDRGFTSWYSSETDTQEGYEEQDKCCSVLKDKIIMADHQYLISYKTGVGSEGDFEVKTFTWCI